MEGSQLLYREIGLARCMTEGRFLRAAVRLRKLEGGPTGPPVCVRVRACTCICVLKALLPEGGGRCNTHGEGDTASALNLNRSLDLASLVCSPNACTHASAPRAAWHHPHLCYTAQRCSRTACSYPSGVCLCVRTRLCACVSVCACVFGGVCVCVCVLVHMKHVLVVLACMHVLAWAFSSGSQLVV